MFGWLPFVDNKILSLSNTLSWLFNRNGSEVNSNLNGEESFSCNWRNGSFFPMDIYPMQLIKTCN